MFRHINVWILQALIIGFAPQVTGSSVYSYTAETVATGKQQGSVKASGIKWRCEGKRCTTAGPWPTPGVASCQALARLIGTIKSYGHKAARLTAGQLKQCNAVTTTALEKPVGVVPRIGVQTPTIRRSLGIGPPPGVFTVPGEFTLRGYDHVPEEYSVPGSMTLAGNGGSGAATSYDVTGAFTVVGFGAVPGVFSVEGALTVKGYRGPLGEFSAPRVIPTQPVLPGKTPR